MSPAGPTPVPVLACGAAAQFLFVAAWIGLMAALALWIVAQGIALDAAVTTVAFADVAGALALRWLCAHLHRSLAFPASGREFRPKRLELA